MTQHDSDQKPYPLRGLIATIGSVVTATEVWVLACLAVPIMRKKIGFSEARGELVVLLTTAIGAIMGAFIGWRGIPNSANQMQSSDAIHRSNGEVCAHEDTHRQQSRDTWVSLVSSTPLNEAKHPAVDRS
jgi:hypothetical protein